MRTYERRGHPGICDYYFFGHVLSGHLSKGSRPGGSFSPRFEDKIGRIFAPARGLLGGLRSCFSDSLFALMESAVNVFFFFGVLFPFLCMRGG